MKVTDYIVEFLISKDIRHVFGYPGGVICHFLDSTYKYSDRISAHLMYHEQAAAFAACGYAQESGTPGVAYSTSGPGATNLITGIANAYYDSIPAIFFTGQVDTYSLKNDIPVRQLGFQETEITKIVETITKYACRIDNPDDIAYELEKAYSIATENNPGPVLIDLPADVQRADIDTEVLRHYQRIKENAIDYEKIALDIYSYLQKSKRPCLLIGNGVKQSGQVENTKALIQTIGVPAVFSMPAFDILIGKHSQNYGFIGANGHRYANFVIGKADLIISIGSRLDLKQVGVKRDQFAPNAQIIRIDIDDGNFRLKENDNDINIVSDIKRLIPVLNNTVLNNDLDFSKWNYVCSDIRNRLLHYDDESYSKLLYELLDSIPEGYTLTCDVGQSQVWVTQQMNIKNAQAVHMSGGLGSMGYSLPAAIGCYYAKDGKVISINGDGGIQMNIQELQFLKREHLPIKVVVINNHALGMIRGFQEANFEKRYVHTTEGSNYSPPDFRIIANAYDMDYFRIRNIDDIKEDLWNGKNSALIELVIDEETYLSPNFGKNGCIQDMRPYIDRNLYDTLMEL